jgi:acetolactate synthase-1/2/3 large subunit
VVEALRRAGVDVCFTVPGESFLGVLDALHEAPLRVVATRHEGGAAFAAEAYGQLTGRPAACLATRAVGASNLAIGLHTARQDSTPLIALVGQVPRAFRGREAFQETDLVATFGGLCKEAVEIDAAALLARELCRLLAVATSGRPGPVLVALPEDVLTDAVVDPAWPEPASPIEEPIDRDGIAAVVRLLDAAERPLILCGAGVRRSGAISDLVRFAEQRSVPVIAAWRRADAFPNEHGLYLGMTGYGAPPTVRARLADADLVLALGTRLSEITTFGYALPNAATTLVQVDLEPGLAGDRRQPDLSITADAGAFLRAALALPQAASSIDRRAHNEADRAAFLAAVEPPDETSPPGAGVHPATPIRALRELLPADAIVTTDAGNFAGWAARYLPITREMRYIGPTSGAMGYALPAAMAAALAEPNRTVVALCGDGGLAMLMAELETCVREGLRLTVVCWDNRMYGTIRMHQEQAHPGRVVATDLGAIDFAAVARACGATARSVDRDEHVAEALRWALAEPGVSLVHLHTDPRILSVDMRLA